MVKHRKWIDVAMLILALLVMSTAIMILVDFIISTKNANTDGIENSIVLGLAFFIILLTFSSATVLLVPVAIYFIKSIHSKLILEEIEKRKPVANMKFPYTRLLLITLYIIEFIVILISTTSFEVMLEAILTNDERIYIVRACISMLQNIMLSIYIIFIIDYLKNKLKEEHEIKMLIDLYNGKDIERKIHTLDKGKISATINITIVSAFIFFCIFIFRIVDASITLANGGNLLNSLSTIFIYTEVTLFLVMAIWYFKTEEKLFLEINSIIENANNNI